MTWNVTSINLLSNGQYKAWPVLVVSITKILTPASGQSTAQPAAQSAYKLSQSEVSLNWLQWICHNDSRDTLLFWIRHLYRLMRWSCKRNATAEKQVRKNRRIFKLNGSRVVQFIIPHQFIADCHMFPRLGLHWDVETESWPKNNVCLI